MRHILPAFILILFAGPGSIEAKNLADEPVRIAIAGLTHDHVHWIFRDDNREDIEIVGFYEPNEELSDRYAQQYDLDGSLFYTDLEDMLDSVNPEAVTAFGSTYEHLALVQASAPRGIDIMVEKPLAVNMDHASQMKELAEQHDVHLLTNYETTWYASNHRVYDLVHETESIGDIRKMVVHDGHKGPKEIGVSEEFLEWLTDPVQNGGGALMDFGCYGINLMTWLMNGAEPLSVMAVTQTHKPDIYPDVDDEATIIVTYPGAQGIIQGSWNWPYNRKDTHVYGQSGYVYALNDIKLQVSENEQPVQDITVEATSYPNDDPFSYFAAVIRGDIIVQDTDLSSLANNLTVVKVLDAARESASTGRAVEL
ncbi:MAG: Gfo/Idh/MocA family oxidoreductase [Balneolales bacterium]